MKYGWLIFDIIFLCFLIVYTIMRYINPPKINLLTLGIIIGSYFIITIVQISDEIRRLRRKKIVI